MRRIWSVAVAFVTGLFGCGPSGSTSSNGLAVAAPKDDPILEVATSTARDSLGNFTACLKDPMPSQSQFSVKVAISSGGMVHYLWLQKITHKDGSFTGTLGPDAKGLEPHQPGETITVREKEIFDWMYVDSGKLVGGYSLRALRDQLSGKQREAFEKSLWFSFD